MCSCTTCLPHHGSWFPWSLNQLGSDSVHWLLRRANLQQWVCLAALTVHSMSKVSIRWSLLGRRSGPWGFVVTAATSGWQPQVPDRPNGVLGCDARGVACTPVGLVAPSVGGKGPLSWGTTCASVRLWTLYLCGLSCATCTAQCRCERICVGGH